MENKQEWLLLTRIRLYFLAGYIGKRIRRFIVCKTIINVMF